MSQSTSADRKNTSVEGSRRKRWASLALKLAISGTLTIALLEVALRIVGVKPATAEVQPRDQSLLHSEPFISAAQRNGWIPWPKERRRIEPVPEHARGFIEIRRNDCSCREDEDTPISVPPSVARIIVLGDSHTDGICFNDESFSNLLERRLNEDRATASQTVAAGDSAQPDSTNAGETKKPAEKDSPIGDARDRHDVVNAGFALSSTYQQYWAFEQVYRRFGPRRVILVFYAGNDLVELLRRDDRVHLEPGFSHAEATGGGDDTRTTKSTWGRVRGLLRDHSATYHALTKVKALRRFVRSADADQYRERLDAAFQAHSAPVWQGLNQAYYFQHHPEEWETAWSIQRRSLELLRDRCREMNCELTFVVLPTMRQIHPETDAAAFDRTISLLQLGDAALARDDEACERAAAVAAALNVECVDLRPALRRARELRPDAPLYYRFDHHLNVDGHVVVAAELDSAMRKFGDTNKPRASVRTVPDGGL